MGRAESESPLKRAYMEGDKAEEANGLLNNVPNNAKIDNLKHGVIKTKKEKRAIRGETEAGDSFKEKGIESRVDIKTRALLLCLKLFVWTYDIVTIPIYFLLQRPWNMWRHKKTVWAARVNPSDPYSPYVRLGRKWEPWAGVRTMDGLFRMCVDRYGTQKCCGQREVICEADVYCANGKMLKKAELGDYKWYTYNEVDQIVDNLCKSVVNIGVKPKSYVVILAETRIEWLLILQTCFRLNIPVATLYPTLSEEGIIHGINETGVTHIFASQECLLKVQKVIDKVPALTHIIYMEDKRPVDLSTFPDKITVIPMTRLAAMADEHEDIPRLNPPTPDDIAILMYTSGSMGVPKGVKMSHSNMVRAASNVVESIDPFKKTDIYIGYLPLAHALEILSEFICFSMGVPVGYGSPFTLTDKSTGIMPGCKGDATVLKPTVICAVPLMLDKIRKAVNDSIQQKGPFAQQFFHFAVQYKLFWSKKGFQTPILNRLVFKKIKDIVGGNPKLIVGGGAPLSSDTHDFIRVVMDCATIQAYGLTETCAGATIMSLNDYSTGRVGPPLSNCFVKIVDWPEGNYFATDQPNPRGEIVLGGECVTAGYFENDELTLESFKEEDEIRWFHTGDIGEMFPDGTLKVIDRKKDLLKLPNGEYISLGKIESELKTSPFVDNMCVIGNGLKEFLVALVAPNMEQFKSLAKKIDKADMSLEDLCKDSDMVDIFLAIIKKQGQKCKLHRTEIPSKIKLCTEEWMPDSGLVTTAFKIRRKAIGDFYQKYIDEMYS